MNETLETDMTPDYNITVVQVIRAMGINPTNDLTWSVGNRMQALWAKEHGRQPATGLTPKTHGGGSHQHAHYPASWRGTIEDEVRKVNKGAADQGDMFAQP